jgi:hypothetical protein
VSVPDAYYTGPLVYVSAADPLADEGRRLRPVGYNCYVCDVDFTKPNARGYDQVVCWSRNVPLCRDCVPRSRVQVKP